MKAKRKQPKTKTKTWRGWGVLEPADKNSPAFLMTYCRELAEDRASDGVLVRVVAKMTPVKVKP